MIRGLSEVGCNWWGCCLVSVSHFLYIAFPLNHVYTSFIYMKAVSCGQTSSLLTLYSFGQEMIRGHCVCSFCVITCCGGQCVFLCMDVFKNSHSGQRQGLNIIELNYSSSPKTHIYSNKTCSYSPVVTPIGVGRVF